MWSKILSSNQIVVRIKQKHVVSVPQIRYHEVVERRIEQQKVQQEAMYVSVSNSKQSNVLAGESCDVHAGIPVHIYSDNQQEINSKL